MFYITTDHGNKIAVYDFHPRNQETVLLLHGWPLSHLMYEYQIGLLARLGYRVVALDLRGFGRSDAPASGYHYDCMADDVCRVVQAAGGSFVARGTVYDVVQLNKLIEQAIAHKGFSFVEVISPCPTHFGRSNHMAAAVEMMRWIKEQTVPLARAASMSPQELEGKFVTGVFENSQREDYSTAYQRVVDRLKGEAG